MALIRIALAKAPCLLGLGLLCFEYEEGGDGVDDEIEQTEHPGGDVGTLEVVPVELEDVVVGAPHGQLHDESREVQHSGHDVKVEFHGDPGDTDAHICAQAE